MFGSDQTSGYDLSSYYILGGSALTTVPSTKITMLGGKVKCIFGGSNALGPYDASSGDTSVIICGVVITEDVYGGGFGVSENSVIGNTSVTVSGRTITLYVLGGGYDGSVSRTACLKVYENASVSRSISDGSIGGGNVGVNSFAECEVAFYNDTTKLKNPTP